jgi:hypothetical protein
MYETVDEENNDSDVEEEDVVPIHPSPSIPQPNDNEMTERSTALTVPSSQSKFQFWFLPTNDSATQKPPSLKSAAASPTAAASLNLPDVSQETNRRRHDLYQNLHDLECRISKLTADLAHESMNFDADVKELSSKTTDLYTQAAKSRDWTSFLQHDGDDAKALQDMNETKHWLMMEQRISSLDAQMTHAVHVKLADYKNKHFVQTIQQDILQKDLPALIEQDRQHQVQMEQYLLEQWESIVGTIARRYAEERATRIVALQTIQEQFSEAVTQDHTSETVASLRQQIRSFQEQMEQAAKQRYEADEQIRALLLHRTEFLQQAILETFGE